MEVPPRQRLTAADWAGAALEALSRGGVDAVAVEPLASRLGATKGSFYWHFKDRESLVQAALDLWEQQQTEAVIGGLSRLGGPADRLRALVDLVLTHPGEEEDPVVALSRDVRHPAVAAALERVTRRRIDYIAAQLAELGMPPAEAARRAAVVYAAYVGWWQLRTLVPDVVPRGAAARPHAAVLRELLGDQVTEGRVRTPEAQARTT
jgi:AcrR family transcriptional regulator